MDIGFCVLKVLLEIRKMGVYGSSLIKNICYWPMGVHRDGINEYWSTKNIGDMGCLSG